MEKIKQNNKKEEKNKAYHGWVIILEEVFFFKTPRLVVPRLVVVNELNIGLLVHVHPVWNLIDLIKR